MDHGLIDWLVTDGIPLRLTSFGCPIIENQA